MSKKQKQRKQKQKVETQLENSQLNTQAAQKEIHT